MDIPLPLFSRDESINFVPENREAVPGSGPNNPWRQIYRERREHLQDHDQVHHRDADNRLQQRQRYDVKPATAAD